MVLTIASCGGGSATIGSAVPPPEAINNLCVAYGTQINREAVNVSATTAGAVTDSLRAAKVNAAPWASQPRAEQVAALRVPRDWSAGGFGRDVVPAPHSCDRSRNALLLHRRTRASNRNTGRRAGTALQPNVSGITAAMKERDTSPMFAGVRPARPGDGPRLQSIERRAGQQFRQVGLDNVADDEPTSVELLTEYAVDGRSWVAVDDADHPIGYVLVDDVDSNAHVEQISVDPAHQGVGVGRALIDRVRVWAERTERPAITLTTFVDVPWNAPLYAHLGFVEVPEDKIGPELRALRRSETGRGLDAVMARTCMELRLDA